MMMAVYRQPFLLLPSLDGSYLASQISRDLLPGVELFSPRRISIPSFTLRSNFVIYHTRKTIQSLACLLLIREHILGGSAKDLVRAAVPGRPRSGPQKFISEEVSSYRIPYSLYRKTRSLTALARFYRITTCNP